MDEADAHSVGSHYSVRGRVCTAMAGLIEVASASAHECAAARFAKYMAFDGRICHSATRRGNVSATECALPPARRPAASSAHSCCNVRAMSCTAEPRPQLRGRMPSSRAHRVGPAPRRMVGQADHRNRMSPSAVHREAIGRHAVHLRLRKH